MHEGVEVLKSQVKTSSVIMTRRLWWLALVLIAPSVFAIGEASNQQENEVQNEKPVAEMPQGVVQLDETVISGNQELPKVLYILPWREPQGLPDIEIQAEFTEAEVFRRLYPPWYRRELQYFDTLDGIKDRTSDNQED